MKNIFMKLSSICLALTMCLASATTTAFAAESEVATTQAESETRSTIIAGKKTVTMSNGMGSVSLYLSSGNYFADHKVKIVGDPGVTYYVSMMAANGQQKTFNAVTGSGTTTVTQGYAQAGTYTYYVNAFGTSGDITVTVWIED